MGEDAIYRIVLVDNDAVPRKIARGICERAAYSIGCRTAVDEFDDGLPAWVYLSQVQEPPRLLLTDMNMADMHGNELIEKVQNKFPKAQFPSLTIILASDTSDESANAMADLAELNGYSFLRKPYDFAKLTEIVRNSAPKSS